MYLLEDYRGKSVTGTFYEHELFRAADPDVYLVEKMLRRRDNKVYMKWLGYLIIRTTLGYTRTM